MERTTTVPKANSYSNQEHISFGKTEMKRKLSLYHLFSKWKVFIDGEFMGYIKNGETKIFNKQGEVFVDMGYFNEDGKLNWIGRYFCKEGIDTAQSTYYFRKLSELYYLECGICWKKFLKEMCFMEGINFCQVKLKRKNLELQPLFG